MTSAFEHLSGPGKALRAEPPDKREYEGDVNIDDRIVTDLLAACQTVAGRVDALAPLT